MNSEEYLNWIQLIINAFALGAAGWIYRSYILNLKASLSAKDEQIKIVEKNISFYKDRVSELQRKTPEFIEDALSKRIKIREEEIERLNLDKENHIIEIEKRNEELSLYKNELERIGELQISISELITDLGDLDGWIDKNKKHKTELAGYVDVDSGQLMITDPSYIDSQWKKESYSDIRIFEDKITGKKYEFRKDFQNFNDKIKGFDKSVNELIENEKFVQIENEKRNNDYSYAGICHATANEEGFGQIIHKRGHDGAAVAFRSGFGDGSYPVYLETFGGRNIRMFIDLI